MIQVSGAELRPGDRIVHPKDEGWRHVYTVVAKPQPSPGSWQLSCECKDPAGKKIRIAVGPTVVVHVERKG